MDQEHYGQPLPQDHDASVAANSDGDPGVALARRGVGSTSSGGGEPSKIDNTSSAEQLYLLLV